MNFTGQNKFNLLCQYILSHIYISYELTLLNSKRSRKGIFWVNMKRFFVGDEFNSIIHITIPSDKQNKNCIIILTYCLTDIFWDYMNSAIEKFQKNMLPTINSESNATSHLNKIDPELKDLHNREICGFVGSALAALLKKYKRLIMKLEPPCK